MPSAKKSGAHTRKIDMNLITYCLLYADYDVFDGILGTLDTSNGEVMNKFYDEVLDACKTAPFAFSFVNALKEYSEAMSNFNSIEDAVLIGRIMACLPPYILQAMCYPAWAWIPHFYQMSSRRTTSQLYVFPDDKEAGVEFQSLFQPGAKGLLACPMLYRWADAGCRSVNTKKSIFADVKRKAEPDHRYISVVLTARMQQIYFKIVELAIFMENNLRREDAWLQFEAVWRSQDHSYEFVKEVLQLFTLYPEDPIIAPIINSIGLLLNRRNQPIPPPVAIIPQRPLPPTPPPRNDNHAVMYRQGMVNRSNASHEKPNRRHR